MVTQLAQEIDDEQGDGPVSVALLAVAGEPVPASMSQALAREVLDVAGTRAVSKTPSVPPAADVVIAWVPARHAADALAALVRWAATAAEPVGLIGCTPSGDRADAEEALAAGFDDFVGGELSVRELAARVRALSRRLHMSANQLDEGPRFGSIVLDRARHQLWIGGRRVTLTRTELAVMQALVAAQGRAISRAEILDAAWGDDSFEVGERAVDNVVMRLRRKLDDRDAIITVRGVGFRLAER